MTVCAYIKVVAILQLELHKYLQVFAGWLRENLNRVENQ